MSVSLSFYLSICLSVEYRVDGGQEPVQGDGLADQEAVLAGQTWTPPRNRFVGMQWSY